MTIPTFLQERLEQFKHEQRQAWLQTKEEKSSYAREQFDFFLFTKWLKALGWTCVHETENFYDLEEAHLLKNNPDEHRSPYTLWTYDHRFLMVLDGYVTGRIQDATGRYVWPNEESSAPLSSQSVSSQQEVREITINSLNAYAQTGPMFSTTMGRLLEQVFDWQTQPSGVASMEHSYHLNRKENQGGYIAIIEQMMAMAHGTHPFSSFKDWTGWAYISPHHYQSRLGEDFFEGTKEAYLEDTRQAFLQEIHKIEPELTDFIQIHTKPRLRQDTQGYRPEQLERLRREEQEYQAQRSQKRGRRSGQNDVLTTWSTHVGCYAFSEQTRQAWVHDGQVLDEWLRVSAQENIPQHTSLQAMDESSPYVLSLYPLLPKPKGRTWLSQEVQAVYDGWSYAHLLPTHAPHLLVAWLEDLPNEDVQTLMKQRDEQGYTFLMFLLHLTTDESFALPVYTKEEESAYPTDFKQYPRSPLTVWIEGVLNVCEERLSIDKSAELLHGPGQSFFGLQLQYLQNHRTYQLERFECWETCLAKRGWLDTPSFDFRLRHTQRHTTMPFRLDDLIHDLEQASRHIWADEREKRILCEVSIEQLRSQHGSSIDSGFIDKIQTLHTRQQLNALINEPTLPRTAAKPRL